MFSNFSSAIYLTPYMKPINISDTFSKHTDAKISKVMPQKTFINTFFILIQRKECMIYQCPKIVSNKIRFHTANKLLLKI